MGSTSYSWNGAITWTLFFLFNTVDQDVRYTAVSSFIFLRFFAPAILSPNLFHLRPHHPVSPAFSEENTCSRCANTVR